MMKFLFSNLLLSNYSFARRWVNKKMPENIIPATLHIFTTPFTFFAAGLYLVVLGSIEYKFQSFLPVFIGLLIVMLLLGYLIEKYTKRAIFKWDIEKKFKSLTKHQRLSKNTFAFIFFWSGFFLFLYLGIKFFGGYSV